MLPLEAEKAQQVLAGWASFWVVGDTVPFISRGYPFISPSTGPTYYSCEGNMSGVIGHLVTDGVSVEHVVRWYPSAFFFVRFDISP